MKRISAVLAMVMTMLFLGCSWFGPTEKYKSDSGHTVFRSAEESPAETATPVPQKIPGASR